MTKKIGWLAAFSFLLVTSCTNDAGTNDSGKSEEQTGISGELEKEQNEAGELQGAFPQFFSFLSRQDTSFSISKFEQTESAPLDSMQASPVDDKKIQPFSDYLIYNSDRSLAIDLYSYGYIPVNRNGKTILERGEPDTEIGLIDTKANTRRRIFFSGPSTSIQQARWENDSTVLFAGVEEAGPNAVKPLLMKFNLANRTMQVYNYSDTLHASISNYTPEKSPEERDL